MESTEAFATMGTPESSEEIHSAREVVFELPSGFELRVYGYPLAIVDDLDANRGAGELYQISTPRSFSWDLDVSLERNIDLGYAIEAVVQPCRCPVLKLLEASDMNKQSVLHVIVENVVSALHLTKHTHPYVSMSLEFRRRIPPFLVVHVPMDWLEIAQTLHHLVLVLEAVSVSIVQVMVINLKPELYR